MANLDFLVQLLKTLLNAKSSNANFARLAAVMVGFTLAILIGYGKYDPCKNNNTTKPPEINFRMPIKKPEMKMNFRNDLDPSPWYRGENFFKK